MRYFSHPITLAAAFAITLASTVSAGAATIDFSAVQGSQGATLVLPEATISNLSGGTILVGPGAASQVDGFCFLLGGTCEADGDIVFTSAVQNLRFDVDGADAGDSVEISAFNGATFLGSISTTTNGLLDFAGFGPTTRLFFDDSSSAAGFGYSTFVYDTTVSAVPLPAAVWLFLTALAGLGFVGRRRRSATV